MGNASECRSREWVHLSKNGHHLSEHGSRVTRVSESEHFYLSELVGYIGVGVGTI